jgi:hypothetical protein
LLPIQVGDDPAGPQLLDRMGRGALRVTATANNRDVHLVAAHLKSKLLTFPRGLQPADENQRARFASYARRVRNSCGGFVLVDEPAEEVAAADLPAGYGVCRDMRSVGW